MVSLRNARTEKSGSESNDQTNGQQDPRYTDLFNQDGLSESEIAFYAALQRAFLTDLNNSLLNSTTLLKSLEQDYAPQAKFDEIPVGQPIHFINKTSGNAFAVTKDSISFVRQGSPFSLGDARGMAKLAALDISMQREGITLEGSEQERALLQAAIEEVNRDLPKNQHLTIHNKLNPLMSSALRQARGESNQNIDKENIKPSEQQSSTTARAETEAPEAEKQWGSGPPVDMQSAPTPNMVQTPELAGNASTIDKNCGEALSEVVSPNNDAHPPSNIIGVTSNTCPDSSESFSKASDPENILPQRDKNDPQIEETVLSRVQGEVIKGHELGEGVSRKDIGALLTPNDYQGSRERAITAVARWLVDKDTLVSVQHGDSPIITRQLNPDNEWVNAVKEQFTNIKHRKDLDLAKSEGTKTANQSQFGNATDGLNTDAPKHAGVQKKDFPDISNGQSLS